MAALRARSIAGVLVVLTVASVAASVDTSANAGTRWRFNRLEKCLMKKVNGARKRHGKRPMGWDKQVGYVARKHAQNMASQRAIWHDGNLGSEITRWRRLGQNTGSGGTCRKVFRAFMRSSGHRSNIFGRWRYTGVGVEKAGGRLWVQHVFQARRDPGNIYHYP